MTIQGDSVLNNELGLWNVPGHIHFGENVEETATSAKTRFDSVEAFTTSAGRAVLKTLGQTKNVSCETLHLIVSFSLLLIGTSAENFKAESLALGTDIVVGGFGSFGVGGIGHKSTLI